MLIPLRAAGATFAAARLSHDHFHFDLLERDLVVDQAEQFEGALVGHVIAAEFDPPGFPSELGMGRQHFPIEQKGNVSVELFLKLMKPLVRSIPRPWFVHGQNDLAALAIDAEKIDHRRIRDAGATGFLLFDAIVLLILRHWAE